MAGKPKAKPVVTETSAADQATGAATAVAVPAAVVADQSGQQDQPVGVVPSSGGEALAQSSITSAVVVAHQGLPQLVIEPESGAPLEMDEDQALVGADANLAIIDEHDFSTEPWEALQRAASDVILERLRQVHGEGFTFERDDGHDNGQLPRAAACYLTAPAGMPSRLRTLHWPFSPEWLKPGLMRDDLVKAGALILAEIERLDRAEAAA